MESRIKIPISLKLVATTVAFIGFTAAYIARESSRLFEESFGKSHQDSNFDFANSKASDVDDLMLGYVEKIRTVTNLLLEDFADESQRKRAMEQTFGRDLDLVSIDIFQMEKGRPKLYKRQINDSFYKQFGFDQRYLDQLRGEKTRSISLSSLFSSRSRVFIKNTTLPKGVPLFSIGVPFQDENGAVHHVAIGDFRLGKLQKSFALSGARMLFLVDEDGVVMAHKDDEAALEARNFATLPIVQTALDRGEPRAKGQKRFFDESENRWLLGAYSKTSFGPTVIAQVPEKVILEPAKIVKYEAFKIAGYVISGALFLVSLISFTLTYPIERLRTATEYVARGDFSILARVRSNDEVGDLAMAFNRMIGGLKERDKVKNILTKFHGSSITEALLKKDVSLGGTRKSVIVFFSDIRGFTKFSEGHTPEEVVEMLNEYFQIMVGIITRHHGVVDKFVGDAIMAVWGAPNSSGDDFNHAVKACLEMRQALAELNKTRLGRGHSEIKIGMGLHAGTAISGTIGSTERMEYTVIGDTVNMAARIEAATKAFGADLLLSDVIAHVVENRFVLELAGSAEVKGKSEPLKMFRVRGLIEDGKTVLISTPYSDYEPEHAEKVHVAS